MHHNQHQDKSNLIIRDSLETLLLLLSHLNYQKTVINWIIMEVLYLKEMKSSLKRMKIKENKISILWQESPIQRTLFFKALSLVREYSNTLTALVTMDLSSTTSEAAMELLWVIIFRWSTKANGQTTLTMEKESSLTPSQRISKKIMITLISTLR